MLWLLSNCECSINFAWSRAPNFYCYDDVWLKNLHQVYFSTCFMNANCINSKTQMTVIDSIIIKIIEFEWRWINLENEVKKISFLIFILWKFTGLFTFHHFRYSVHLRFLAKENKYLLLVVNRLTTSFWYKPVNIFQTKIGMRMLSFVRKKFVTFMVSFCICCAFFICVFQPTLRAEWLKSDIQLKPTLIWLFNVRTN